MQCIHCDDGPWQASTEIPWLQLSATPDAIQVALVPDTLTPGIHQGEVVVSAPAATGLPRARVLVTAVIGDLEELLPQRIYLPVTCLLYTSDAADEEDSVDLGHESLVTPDSLTWRAITAALLRARVMEYGMGGCPMVTLSLQRLRGSVCASGKIGNHASGQ